MLGPILLLGSTAPWGGPLAAGAGITGAAAVALFGRASRSTPFLPLSPLSAALAGVALLAAVQAIPLPAALVSFLSPSAALVWAAPPSAGGANPLSLAPAESVGAALLWISAASLHAAVAWWAAGHRAQRRALAVMAGIAACVGVAAAAERALGLGLWSRYLSQPEQGMGPFPNRNDLALLAASALPLAAAGLDSAGGRLRALASGGTAPLRESPDLARIVLWAAALAALLAVACVSGSRTGLLAFAAGIAVFIGVRARGARRSRATSWEQTAGFAWRALPLGVVLAALAWTAARGRVPGTEALASELGIRVELWKSTLAMAIDYPLFGVGLGAWPAVLPRYADGLSWGFPGHAENDLLEFAAEAGLIGLGVLALGAAAWLRPVLKLALAGGPGAARAAGVLGAVAAFGVGSMGTFAVSVPALLLWMAAVTGIGAATAASAVPEGASTGLAQPQPGRRPRIALAAALVLAPIVLARLIGAAQAVPSADRAALLRASRWDPNQPRVVIALARSYEREALESPAPFRDAMGPLEEAATWYGRRLALRPTDAYSRLALAALLETAARGENGSGPGLRAQATILRAVAVEMEPGNPAVARLAAPVAPTLPLPP